MSNSLSVQVHPAGRYPAARVEYAGRAWPAVVGRGGVVPAANKREGDMCTPAGDFVLRQVLYRPDRLPRPQSGLPVREIGPDDVWCDDPQAATYNSPVQGNTSARGERMWRDDHVYDLIAVIGYNDAPAVPELGSAIFLHVARNEGKPDLNPTAGCGALRRENLVELLSLLPGDAIVSIRHQD